MRTSTALSPLRLVASDGKPVVVGELWNTKPVVLVFLRHFG
jgi:hypothetical protein